MCGIGLYVSGLKVANGLRLPTENPKNSILLPPSTDPSNVSESIHWHERFRALSDEFIQDWLDLLRRRGPSLPAAFHHIDHDLGDVLFMCCGTTLHLRGANPVPMPLVARTGNFLLFNGEIYSGLDLGVHLFLGPQYLSVA